MNAPSWAIVVAVGLSLPASGLALAFLATMTDADGEALLLGAVILASLVAHVGAAIASAQGLLPVRSATTLGAVGATAWMLLIFGVGGGVFALLPLLWIPAPWLVRQRPTDPAPLPPLPDTT